jgi:hypothetical protein
VFIFTDFGVTYLSLFSACVSKGKIFSKESLSVLKLKYEARIKDCHRIQCTNSENFILGVFMGSLFLC